MTTLAMHGGRTGQPLQEGAAFLHAFCTLAAFYAAFLIDHPALQSHFLYAADLLRITAVCRRAAHFAHFGADDEAEDGDNLHTGGTEV